MNGLQHFFRNHKVALSIFILALVVRCIYLGLSIHAYQGNTIGAVQAADGYYAISQNLLQGHGFSSATAPPYTANSFRPPLQPYFLAGTHLLFGSYWGAIVLLMLIGSIVPLLGMGVAGYLFDSPTVRIGTGVVLALEPVAIALSTLFYSETLFMLFFLLALWCAFKYVRDEVWQYGVLSAVLLGAATLTKTVTLYLPLLLVALFLIHVRKELTARRIFAAAAYLVIFVLVISPWLYRNYREFHAIGLTSEEGVTLYTVLVPSVLAIDHGTSFRAESGALTAAGVQGPNQATVDLSSGYVRDAVPILLAHPAALALVCGNTLLAFFTDDGMRDFLIHVGLKPDKPLGAPALFLLFSDPLKLLGLIGHYAGSPIISVLVMRLFWYAATLLFLTGAARSLRRRELTFSRTAALGIVFYFALLTLTIGLNVNARYRVPVEFLIIPFAFSGLLYLKERFL